MGPNFLTQLPIQCSKILDPTQPNPWMDPTHVQLCGTYRQHNTHRNATWNGKSTKIKCYRASEIYIIIWTSRHAQ